MQTGKETRIVLKRWKKSEGQNTNTNGGSNLLRGKGHVCHCQLSSQWRFTEAILPLSSSPRYSNKKGFYKYKRGNTNTNTMTIYNWSFEIVSGDEELLSSS